MYRSIARVLLVPLSIVASGATAALAQVDVELAFDPSTASPGQQVLLTASIANRSGEAATTSFTVTVQWNDLSFGPVAFEAPMPAGAERSADVPFVVPALPMGGTLTVVVAARVGDATDTARASLTIVPGFSTAPDLMSIRRLGPELGSALAGGNGSVAVQGRTLSELKRLYH